MKEETIIFAVTMLLCLTSVASTSGVASFYAGPYIPSACYGYSDNGTNIISVSDALWDNRNACGRKYRLWCKIVSEGIYQPCTGDHAVYVSGYDVTVVDHCGQCNVVSTTSIGVASFYAEPYLPSACYGNNDNGTNIISVSDELWDNRNACGRKYKLWCKPVSEGIFEPCTDDIAVNVFGYEATVVDYCGQCNGFTMLLSQEVFSALTNTNNGKIQVEYLQIKRVAHDLRWMREVK
ncbi:hypothetical protein IEQ34_002493 [Dendrobium chrysotoxum]|uniref:Expansin-like EG45 domain-containing protein n=1 Tax=Dendrobium chrysotoxum TaxID=161865 RepID=A0AAV7HJR3_DENCH|nr:hypothetical protein IEQ34_002493 [Dendrobium chrysotoxum]